MKLKQRPEDFRVEERNALTAGADGAFALYRLEKTGLGTPEALRRVAKAWRVPRRHVSCSGLKDTHGRTGQVVSVRHGPRENLREDRLKLNYLGRAARPATRSTLLGNDFRIVVRDLAADEAERVAARVAEVARDGFANYFDDQRFGSLRGTDGAFVARALLDGDDERALRLAVASPSRLDRGAVRRRRALLRDRWGDWDGLVAALDRSFERAVCERLTAGATFAEAYSGIDPALRTLHLSAYQAHLFNACLRRAAGPGPSVPGAAGPYVFGPLPPDLRLPLASAEASHPLLDAVLAEDPVDLGRLPFRRGEREAVVVPEECVAAPPAPDELNPGRVAVALRFGLPPGAYATMLVKRCAHDV